MPLYVRSMQKLQYLSIGILQSHVSPVYCTGDLQAVQTYPHLYFSKFYVGVIFRWVCCVKIFSWGMPCLSLTLE